MVDFVEEGVGSNLVVAFSILYLLQRVLEEEVGLPCPTLHLHRGFDCNSYGYGNGHRYSRWEEAKCQTCQVDGIEPG